MTTTATRHDLLRRARLLEIGTIGWNLVEAGVAVTTGILAGSVALVSFGLDSVIEVAAGAFVLRRLHSEIQGAGDAEVDSREETALRVVGVTFLLLSAYIIYRSVSTLLAHGSAPESTLGMIQAGASLVVMPLLAWGKLRTGRQLESSSMVADSKESLVCAYLSASLLLGLALSTWGGWWWADPVAALAMVPVIAREGWEAMEGGESNIEGRRSKTL